jgi:hypothetical protein
MSAGVRKKSASSSDHGIQAVCHGVQIVAEQICVAVESECGRRVAEHPLNGLHVCSGADGGEAAV